MTARQKAFTVLELILIVALVLLIVSLTKPVLGPQRPAPSIASKQITRLREALEQYRRDTGLYPTSTNGLKALVEQPPGSTNWHGPYTYSIPKDPWGHEYVYRFPSLDAGRDYDLFSLGVPGKNSPIRAMRIAIKIFTI